MVKLHKKILLLFTLCFAIYTLSWVAVYFLGINKTLIQSEDTYPGLYLPVSLLENGTFYLDEYCRYLGCGPGTSKPFYLVEVGGHYLSFFPVGASILAIPVYFIPLKLGMVPTLTNVAVLGKITAALLVSGSVVFVYLIMRRLLGSCDPCGRHSTEAGTAVLRRVHGTASPATTKSVFGGLPFKLALAYAFGSSAFALSSQSLWQHGASQLFLSAALYFLVRGDDEPGLAPWAGLFLSFATLSRYTNAVSVIFLSIYYLTKFNWKSFFKYVGLGLLPLSWFLLYNFYYFGSFSNQGYAAQVVKYWTSPFPQGWLGLFISPSKGLFIYSPIFIFSFIGAFLYYRKLCSCGKALAAVGVRNGKAGTAVLRRVHGTASPATTEMIFHIFTFLPIIILVYSLIVGKWIHWFGGWAFSYRMLVDMTPYLAVMWVPLVQSEWWPRLRKWFWTAFVWSLGIQLMGIGFYNGSWHREYDLGELDQSWLWSVRNCEIVYYFRKLQNRVFK